MAFNSIPYVVFFAVVAAVNFSIPKSTRWAFLLLASMIFCGFSDPIFLVQVLLATAWSFLIAIKIERTPEKSDKKMVLILAISGLIGNLFYYKYFRFAIETLQSTLGLVDIHSTIDVSQALLPIGISFYTLQLIGYLVDVFRGAKAERHVGLFALYVTLFPKLVAGPIERGKNLLPQLREIQGFHYERVVMGLQLVAWGAFKKVVVADQIAPFVNRAYEDPQAYDGVVMTFVTWLYAFQLYCDFSGYTDMALGAAAILGLKLMQNFNRPYFATSIQDFWKRWHISLTSWLTEYVYTPLTRTKMFRIKWYNLMLLSLFVTFVISGLWHGAEWHFVAWGALHGTYLIASVHLQKPWNRFAKMLGLTKRFQFYRGLKIATTFIFVCFAYVLFRAESISDALHIYGNLHTGWAHPRISLEKFIAGHSAEILVSLFGIGVVMMAEVLDEWKNLGAFLARNTPVRWSVYYAGALCIIMLGAFYGTDNQFIYFRF